jgi:hypothetical protein
MAQSPAIGIGLSVLSSAAAGPDTHRSHFNEQLRGSKIASLTGRQDLGFVADDHLRPDGVFVVPALAHRGPEMT